MPRISMHTLVIEVHEFVMLSVRSNRYLDLQLQHLLRVGKLADLYLLFPQFCFTFYRRSRRVDWVLGIRSMLGSVVSL